jgi:hypothetical protein
MAWPYIVICQQARATHAVGPHVIRHVDTRNGHGWGRQQGRRGLTSPIAVASFVGRASQPTPADPLLNTGIDT